MERYEIAKKIEDFKNRTKNILEVLKMDSLNQRIKEIEEETFKPDFWSDQRRASALLKESNLLKDKIKRFNNVQDEVDELEILFEFEDDSVETNLDLTEKVLSDFEISLLLSDEFDANNAIIEIHPGAGGTESQDWASMLFRMYTRFAERHNFSCEIIDYEEAEDAGLKSVTMQINGDYAYGKLKGEQGVHRLVRISPFDSSARRHTSFVGITVIPEVNDDIEIEIKEEDVRIDTYRSSGAGGQHINKTDSAVRLTHIPTGIVVCSQSQRSQIQNREKAFQVLKARLYQRELEIQKQKKQEQMGTILENGWGSQIRSYVLHPYSLVKDHRTNTESQIPTNVLDGDLDQFIDSYLKWLKK